jgi:mRNA interferase MazF
VQRGDLFLVTISGPQVLIDSKFSSVVCAQVYSRYDGLQTQVTVGVDDGLKHPSSIHCDELASLPKSMPTHFIGHLKRTKVEELGRALASALDLDLMLIPPGELLQ